MARPWAARVERQPWRLFRHRPSGILRARAPWVATGARGDVRRIRRDGGGPDGSHGPWPQPQRLHPRERRNRRLSEERFRVDVRSRDRRRRAPHRLALCEPSGLSRLEAGDARGSLLLLPLRRPAVGSRTLGAASPAHRRSGASLLLRTLRARGPERGSRLAAGQGCLCGTSQCRAGERRGGRAGAAPHDSDLSRDPRVGGGLDESLPFAAPRALRRSEVAGAGQGVRAGAVALLLRQSASAGGVGPD